MQPQRQPVIAEVPAAGGRSRDRLVGAGRWQVGAVIVDFAVLEATAAGAGPQRLTPKAAAVLLALCRHAGQTLSRDQLLDAAWPDEAPTPDVLSHAVREIRRALGSADSVLTVPRLGYRLDAPASPLPVASTRVPAPDGQRADQSALRSTPPATAPRPEDGGRSRAWWLAAVLLLATVAWWLSPSVRTPTDPVPAPVPAVPAAGSDTTALTAPNLQLLTSSLAAERQPAISADGRWLAFVHQSSDSSTGSTVLWSALEHAAVAQPIDPPAHLMVEQWLPQWSPDGQQLAWQQVDGQVCEIRIAQPHAAGTPVRGAGPCAVRTHDAFAWSVDGQALWLASADPAAVVPAPRLIRRPLDGGADQPLRYSRSEQDYDHEPRPSPDGRWLVFRRSSGSTGGALHVVATSGGTVRRLTGPVPYLGRAAWLADSSALLVTAGGSGGLKLFHLDRDSGTDTDLATPAVDFPDVATQAGLVVLQRVRQPLQVSRVRLTTLPERPESPLPVADLQPLAPSTGQDRGGVFHPQRGGGLAFLSNRNGGWQVWRQFDPGQPPVVLTRFPPRTHLAQLAFSSRGEALSVMAVEADGYARAWLLPAGPGPALAPDQMQQLIPPRAHQNLRCMQWLDAARRWLWLAQEGDDWSAWTQSGAGERSERMARLRGLAPAMELDGETVLLTDRERGDIVAVPPPYTDARLLAGGLPLGRPGLPGGWRLAAGAIWYLDLHGEPARVHLWRAALAPRLLPRPVLDLGAFYSAPFLEIDPEARELLLTHGGKDQSDIALWHLPH